MCRAEIKKNKYVYGYPFCSPFIHLLGLVREHDNKNALVSDQPLSEADELDNRPTYSCANAINFCSQ